MSNKQTLQNTNTDLARVLTELNKLPAGKSWGGGTIIEPGTNDILIPAYTDRDLTVSGDENLASENIREGISIFGIKGTMKAYNPTKFSFSGAPENKFTLETTKPPSYIAYLASYIESGYAGRGGIIMMLADDGNSYDMYASQGYGGQGASMSNDPLSMGCDVSINGNGSVTIADSTKFKYTKMILTSAQGIYL